VNGEYATHNDDPAWARVRGVLRDVDALDKAVFATVVATPTPDLDRPLRALSRSADRSMLWIGVAAGLAVFGGRKGRRAAILGLASVGATSATVNLLLKHGARRPRPERPDPHARHVPMPASSSFPSGHSASAFAFATAVAREFTYLALPIDGLATLVAYSRVHTAVHYPSDVVAGGAMGGAIGAIVSRLGGRALARSRVLAPH
jgi:membrane-associated phospholipid phosphatase